MDANEANSSRQISQMEPPKLEGQDEEEEKKQDIMLKKSTSELINAQNNTDSATRSVSH